MVLCAQHSQNFTYFCMRHLGYPSYFNSDLKAYRGLSVCRAVNDLHASITAR